MLESISLGYVLMVPLTGLLIPLCLRYYASGHSAIAVQDLRQKESN